MFLFLFSCYLVMLFLNFVVFLVAWLLSFLQEQTDTSGLVLLPKAFSLPCFTLNNIIPLTFLNYIFYLTLKSVNPF